MKKQIIMMLSGAVMLLLLWSSCSKKVSAVAPPLPGNEPLTTMVLHVTNAADPTDTQTAKWIQLDPNGVAAPDTSTAQLTLKKNTSYNVTVQLLDTLNDLTSEIKTRENYHLFCFNVSSGLNLTCVQTDKDTNPTPLPVGLTDLFTADSVSTGTLEVVLHHQPNVKNGQCDPGSIDMDCSFKVGIIFP